MMLKKNMVILIKKEGLTTLHLKILHLLKKVTETFKWCCKPPSDKEDVLQFVGEQNGLNKSAALNISKNSQPLSFLSMCPQTILPATVQDTNYYMEQDAQYMAV
jgi:hypothetical protein